MKAYITGTTQGLGKQLQQSLYNHLFEKHSFEDVEVIGLNRPEFDINDVESVVREDFDFYIINAHDGFSGVELLYQLFELNQQRECHIIVVGSVSADGDRSQLLPYCVEKAALDKAVSQLQMIESECKVSIIKPGRMVTRMTQHRTSYRRMDTKVIADAIIWMISQPSFINVKTLTVDVHNSNRKLQ